MSTSEPNTGLSSESDVKPWWKLWERNQTWRENLARRAAHKALDIPDEAMDIHNSRTGIGALGAIGIALAAGLPAAGLAALMFLRSPETPSAPTEQPQHVGPVDSEYEVIFYDANGNKIDVPHIKEAQ